MYTFSDIENIVGLSRRTIIAFIVLGLFVLFLLTLIGIGLSRGDRLDFAEKAFVDYSTLTDPTATCLEHHRQVLSTVSRYEEFVSDCRWTVSDEYNANDFQTSVVVLYFVKDTVLKRPVAFFDYPFMVEGSEVIRVRSRSWETEEDAWYVYMIELDKDQIDSADVVFD